MSAAIALALSAAACGSSGSGGSSTATPQPAATSNAAATAAAGTTTVATSGPPAGVIAIGHSGLTGEGTGVQFAPMPENSWATGTSRDVNSVYARLVAARPETLGHVANTARGGASADELQSQATSALAKVPNPALAIISTIDNDIRCDGTDAEHIPEFGAAVADALDAIRSAAPDAKILVVGQAGRPDPAFVKRLVAHAPAVKADLSGPGICSFYDENGHLVAENFKTLTSIIDAYEAEQARVCAAVPNCVTDGGVRAAYKDKLANFSPDWNHLNVRGQAAEAALIWPVVADLLGV